uniref:Uncharacterized protein n=1 Tax=Triticum urartu TaxID=4572 RepID=A0A8R7P7Z3_TRIUA
HAQRRHVVGERGLVRRGERAQPHPRAPPPRVPDLRSELAPRPPPHPPVALGQRYLAGHGTLLLPFSSRRGHREWRLLSDGRCGSVRHAEQLVPLVGAHGDPPPEARQPLQDLRAGLIHQRRGRRRRRRGHRRAPCRRLGHDGRPHVLQDVACVARLLRRPRRSDRHG